MLVVRGDDVPATEQSIGVTPGLVDLPRSRGRPKGDGRETQWGEEPSNDELLVRLALSFVLVQDSALPLGDEEQAAELARALIAPMLM